MWRSRATTGRAARRTRLPYYEHVRAAGQIASVHAEAALTRRFGMSWVARPDGMGFGIDGVGADLMGVFSHRRAEITKLTAQELVPRFKAEHGRVPNQGELAALQERATLRTRVNKDGVTDWDAAARGWQAKAAQKAGVDLASLYRRVTRLGRNGGAPRDAGTQLTRDEITRAAQKALDKCSREDSKPLRRPSGGGLSPPLESTAPHGARNKPCRRSRSTSTGESPPHETRHDRLHRRSDAPDPAPGDGVAPRQVV
jgi:hypothetical protein